MFRPCVTVFVLLNIVLSEADNESSFTSPVLKKSRTNILNFAGKTYYIGNIFRANFFRASQFCRQQGMQLVSISSQAENERIGKYVQEIGSQAGHFWTSGSNLADKNQWIWTSTGDNLVYSNWRSGEPSYTFKDNVMENCIEAIPAGKGFIWNDLSCTDEIYFICEATGGCRR